MAAPLRLLCTGLALVAAAAAAAAVRHDFTGTPSLRSNPERGFRHELHGACTNEWSPTRQGISEDSMAQMAAYNLTVAQVYCYLPTDSVLDNRTLAAVDAALNRLRRAGVKALWRFAYDRLAPGEQDYTAELIVSHIAQLREVFNRGIDVVYVLQTGWLGSWGEWHSSKSAIESNKTATTMVVAASLFELLPSDKKMTIRTGMDKAQKVLSTVPNGGPGDRLAFGIADAYTAHLDKAFARIGFENDAIVSNPADCGTYTGGSGAFPPTNDSTCFFNDCDSRTPRTFGPQQEGKQGRKAWSRADLHGPPIELSFATPIYDSLHGPMIDPSYEYTRRESPFVPMDCEMDWNSGAPRDVGFGCNNDAKWPLKIEAETFAWRAREMHYSTLSMAHGFSVFDADAGKNPSWVNNETIDAWMVSPLNLTRLYLDKLPVSRYYAAASHTGYEYIRDHLGYRLELQHATWPDQLDLRGGHASFTGTLSFTATLLNWGFAAPTNPRPVRVVVLSANKTRILWRSPSLADPRAWQPYLAGDPFFTPVHHSFGGDLEMELPSELSCVPSAGKAGYCTLPIGLLMADARNEKFAEASIAQAYSIRLANENVEWVGIGDEGGINVLGEINVQSDHAAAERPPQYRVTTRVDEEPLLAFEGYGPSNSDWQQVFNPTWVEPTHQTGNRSGLLVRSQNCTQASTPGTCGPTCGGTGQHASWLTWVELLDDDSPSTAPRVKSRLTNDSAVFGPFDCVDGSPCPDAWGTEDPRLSYDAATETYFLLYNAYTHEPHPSVFLSVATTTNPTERSGWTRHGPIFPEDAKVDGWPAKSGSLLLMPYPHPTHYVIWGCASELRITPSVGRDLLRWDYNKTKILLGVRAAPFWDTGFVESAMPPLTLRDGNFLFFYDSVGEWNGTTGFQSGWAVLDKDDPSRVLDRAQSPPLPYTHAWEKGARPTWPCNTANVANLGGAHRVLGPNPFGGDDLFRVYYGGADAVVGSALISVERVA